MEERGQPQGREDRHRGEPQANPREHPDRELIGRILRIIDWQFSGRVEEENQERVEETIRSAFNAIRTNIPGISQNRIIENIINHGREMIDDGWLR